MDVINKYMNNIGKASSSNPTPVNSSSSQSSVFNTNNEEYLAHKKRKLISPYELKTGSFIPAVMLGGIN
jgi:type IV secretory pathway VirB10-like protein